MTKTKEQEITDTRTPQDIEKDKNQGKKLLRIYIGLVIVSVVVYLALHWLVPADIKQVVGLEARDNSLTSITRAEIVISAAEVDMETVNAQLTKLSGTITEILGITGTQAARIAEAFKDASDKIHDKALEHQKNQFEVELGRLRTDVAKLEENPQTVGIDVDRVANLIEKMEEENKKDDPNSGVLKVRLEDLKDEITKGKIVGRYFWSTGWLKWLELFFWALLGTFFYAIMRIQRGLRVGEEFRNETAGYINFTIRGPFVAVLLIFALSTIKLEVAKVGIDFTTAPIYVLIFFAGVLGLFSRMAYRQLQLIVKGIFPKAWAFAHPEELSILPPTATVAFGEAFQFKVHPKRDVKWDILPDDLGTIDSAGKYMAPEKKGQPPGAVAGAPVTVRATLKEEPSRVETAKVTLYEKFDVKGDAEVGFTTKHKYRVEPEQEGGVTWSLEPQLGEITGEGEYTAPKEGEPPQGKKEPIAKVGTEIEIKATRNKEPKESVTKKIKLVEGT